MDTDQLCLSLFEILKHPRHSLIRGASWKDFSAPIFLPWNQKHPSGKGTSVDPFPTMVGNFARPFAVLAFFAFKNSWLPFRVDSVVRGFKF
jgi:hypothetical protein